LKKTYQGFNKPMSKNAAAQTEHRRSYRYPVEARVRLSCGQFTKETRSIELSNLGLSIRDSWPQELIDQEIEVQITYISSTCKELTVYSRAKLAPNSDRRMIIFDSFYGLDIFLENIWRQPLFG
jgi:hypothetical protein